MSRQKRKRQKQKSRPQLVAMILVGSGLLILGFLALILLPKPDIAPEAKAGSASSQPSSVPAQVNFTAPVLNLVDLDGKPVSLADFRDQVVLVNNWATWCPPCKAEMPTLQAYFEAHRAQRFTIIGIEAGDPASDVGSFVKSFGLTFPVWLDPNQKALLAFRNPGLPNSYVIDRNGRARLAWTGAISREALEKYVTPLVEE